MYSILGNKFRKESESTRSISGANEIMSEEWAEKQANSVEEYQETHIEGYPDHIQYIFRIYEMALSRLISSKLSASGEVNVLDIGCGISSKRPPYFGIENEQVNYIGVDPINENLERDYLFINSTVEELDKLLEPNSIDIFCFSTSLDHIENLDILSNVLPKIAKSNARVIVLQSIRDSGTYADYLTYSHLSEMNSGNFSGSLNYIRYMNRMRVFFANVIKHRESVAKREKQMEKSEALDDLHFHYFKRIDLERKVNELFGELIESFQIKPYSVLITINKLDEVKR